MFKYFKLIGKKGKIEYKNTNASLFNFENKEIYLFDYREKDKVLGVFKYNKIEL